MSLAKRMSGTVLIWPLEGHPATAGPTGPLLRITARRDHCGAPPGWMGRKLGRSTLSSGSEAAQLHWIQPLLTRNGPRPRLCAPRDPGRGATNVPGHHPWAAEPLARASSARPPLVISPSSFATVTIRNPCSR